MLNSGPSSQENANSDGRNRVAPAGAIDASIECGENNQEMMTEDPYGGPDNSGSRFRPCNIVISVKNTDNLDEFTTKTFIEPEYIPKL